MTSSRLSSRRLSLISPSNRPSSSTIMQVRLKTIENNKITFLFTTSSPKTHKHCDFDMLKKRKLKDGLNQRNVCRCRVVDNFNFERVHAVMKFLDWRWGVEAPTVPSVEQLRSTAISLLKDIISGRAKNKQTSISTGGLSATGYFNSDSLCRLTLTFELTLSEVDLMELR